ncbi:MAG TPA: RNA polymerase sigma factor [Actinomycetota bacterium]|nr:RNA polymerase sigma factor [Actinomycetota bacterium]
MRRTMLEWTDTELLEAISGGDRQALRMLYDRHARWLLLRLHRRSSDAGLNEEVVQDCFVKVWRRSSSYRGDGEVAAWLWTITLRALVDRLRRRTPMPSEAAPKDEPVASAEDQILLGLQHGEVGAALDRLAPELRAVLQATVLDGLTVEEASQLLGIPAGTVKTRAMRARRLLREELA